MSENPPSFEARDPAAIVAGFAENMAPPPVASGKVDHPVPKFVTVSGETYPKKGEDGRWRDANRTLFKPDQHRQHADGVPIVGSKGCFRGLPSAVSTPATSNQQAAQHGQQHGQHAPAEAEGADPVSPTPAQPAPAQPKQADAFAGNKARGVGDEDVPY